MAQNLLPTCPVSSKRSWNASIKHHLAGRVLATFLVGTTSLGALIAVPQQASAQSKQQMLEARDAFMKASEFFEKEDYLAAAAEFLNAYKLSNRSALLYNVGQAFRLAGELDDAERYLQQYLVEQPDAPNTDEVAEIIINIQQAIAARMATLTIATEPSDQNVFINAETASRCKSPCTLTLAAGEYEVHVRADGWSPRSRTVRIAAGEKSQVRLELERIRQEGSLLVRTDIRQGTLRIAPNIELSLPLSGPVKLLPGEHAVELVGSKRAIWRGKINVAANETTEILVPMQALTEASAASSPLRVVSYGLAGASLGLITGAIIMGIQADDTHTALQTQRQAFGVVDADLLAQGKNEQFSANILWGAGAATLLTGAGLYVWDWLSNSPKDEPAANESTQTAYPKESPDSSTNENKSNVDLLD